MEKKNVPYKCFWSRKLISHTDVVVTKVYGFINV